MGLPDTEYPTGRERWTHRLTIPRVFTVEDGKLKQRPFKQLEDLRTGKETTSGHANKFKRKLYPYEGKQCEMIIDILEDDTPEIYFELRSPRSGSASITYNKRENKPTLDRANSGTLSSNVDGTTRSTILDSPLKQLRIFVDTPSIEIFYNDGERVLASRILPNEDVTGIRAPAESSQVYLRLTKYELKG